MTALAHRARVVRRRTGVPGGAWVMAVLVALGVGTALGIGVHPLAVVGGLAMTGAFVAAARRLEPLFVLAVLVFLLPSFAFVRGAEWALALRWVALGGVLMALAARVFAGRIALGAAAPVPVSLITFTGFAVVTTAWSVAPPLTAGRAITFLSMITILGLVRAIDGAARQVANALRVVGAVVAFGGITTVGFGALTSERYAGLFVSPNTLGAASALLFPLALERALESRVRWVRVINGLTAALLVGEAAAAASRGGLLAAAAAYLYLGWSRFRHARPRTRFATLVLPAVLAVVASITVIDPNRLSSIDSRTSLWSLFPQIFWERPLLGHGFGTTQLLLRPFSSITGYLDPRGVDFHNSYLNVLSDTGVVGGILLALLIARAVRRRRLAPPAMAAVIVAGLVSAVFESWLLSVGAGFSFVFWFAMVEVASARQAPAPTRTVVP